MTYEPMDPAAIREASMQYEWDEDGSQAWLGMLLCIGSGTPMVSLVVWTIKFFV